MKLIQQTSRAYLLLSIILFILGGIVLAIILTTVMNRRLDEKLLYNKEVIEKIIKYDYPFTLFEEPEELNEAENRMFPNDTVIFKDTLISHAIEDLEGAETYEKYRQLTAYETLQGKRYKIIARNSLVRNQDFITIITVATILTILLLLTGLWFLNTRITKRIWNPFQHNLNSLKNFSIQDQEPIDLKKSNIDEFKELNKSIKSLTEKVRSDFDNLKEFTGNASHEMQTPLAIMQSKIELLLQSENLNKEESKQLQAIYHAGQRLSKLNKTLLTLAKVENRQFSELEEINITEVINNKLDVYEDFIQQKKLTVTKNLNPDTMLNVNSTIIEMLISNLLSNAIKHNVTNGKLNLELKPEYFYISNTGEELSVEPESLFNRFKKASTSPDSSGLGLAIVKKICDINNWKIDYTYIKNEHQIMVRF
ncbi:MAG: HAMP domain-containing histidine kinase [Flavobacteriaceae bacterium]|nr:HAMP domain-containing histidine kinase [Flavobacteriaceae bacterium]